MFLFFRPQTVDAAIAPLLKAEKGLEGVVALNAREIESNNTAIERLTFQNGVALGEQNRANGVLAALRGIINPTEE